jgi:hypothetical protein
MVKKSTIRNKCVSLLIILLLLTANIGYALNAYAASTDNAPSSVQTANPTGNSGSENPNSVTDQGTGTSSQKDSTSESVSTGSSPSSTTTPVLADNNEDLTGRVYSQNSNGQETDYSAVPSDSMFGVNKLQAGGLSMRRFINMPKFVAPVYPTNETKPLCK